MLIVAKKLSGEFVVVFVGCIFLLVIGFGCFLGCFNMLIFAKKLYVCSEKQFFCFFF